MFVWRRSGSRKERPGFPDGFHADPAHRSGEAAVSSRPSCGLGCLRCRWRLWCAWAGELAIAGASHLPPVAGSQRSVVDQLWGRPSVFIMLYAPSHTHLLVSLRHPGGVSSGSTALAWRARHHAPQQGSIPDEQHLPACRSAPPRFTSALDGFYSVRLRNCRVWCKRAEVIVAR